MIQKTVQILNKRAKFEYEILDKYTAGIVLVGTEIKSIRLGKASIAESFCEFNDKGELFVINSTIEAYDFGTYYNHRPKSERKLLLQKKELRKLNKEVKNSGLTIVPLKLFINEKGSLLRTGKWVAGEWNPILEDSIPVLGVQILGHPG